MKSWRSVAVAAAGLLVAGCSAETGTLVDLGSLLSSQKNLSTFYGLIQVCRSGRALVYTSSVREYFDKDPELTAFPCVEIPPDPIAIAFISGRHCKFPRSLLLPNCNY